MVPTGGLVFFSVSCYIFQRPCGGHLVSRWLYSFFFIGGEDHGKARVGIDGVLAITG